MNYAELTEAKFLSQFTHERGEFNFILDLTLAQCNYLYSKGVKVEKVKNSIYPTHYKLTLEK